MNLAYAHGGVEHTAAVAPHASLLTDWSFDPTFLVPLLVALLYFKGYLRYRRRGGRRFPLWRPALFATGVTVVALALMSPIDVLADYSFTWHMAQHDLLMLVAVPLILLGAPFIPVVRGLPLAVRRYAFIPIARQGAVRLVLRFVTHPLVALVLYEATVVAWHFPGLYDAALFGPWVHYGMHASFIVMGVCFWWHIVTPYPFPSRLHHFLRIGMLVASSIVNGALSALIVFADKVLYGYEFLPGFWGLTMLDDQAIGSGLMWVMGDMLRLAAITVIFAAYAMQEEAKEPGQAGAKAKRRHAAAHKAPQGA
jgi:cytochrome c oxidase assembly factor CtaG